MNIRPLEQYGLKLTVLPKDVPTEKWREKMFLTGEDPPFELEVQNQKEENREGIVYLTWKLGDYLTPRPVNIKLAPGEVERYPLSREYLILPGTAVYHLRLMGEPEEVRKKARLPPGITELPEGEVTGMLGFTWQEVLNSGVHTLCSFRVMDNTVFEREEELHRRNLEHQKVMENLTQKQVDLTQAQKQLSKVILALTIIMAIMAILQAILLIASAGG